MTKNCVHVMNYHKHLCSGRSQAASFLEEFLSLPSGSLSYGETAAGKPYILNQPQISISLSHSEGLLALFCGREEAGIDIEFMKPRTSYREIAEIIFSHNDLAQYLESKDQPRTFYTLWTRYEAEAKKAGQGINALLSKTWIPSERYTHWIVSNEYILCLCASERVLSTIEISCEPDIHLMPL